MQMLDDMKNLIDNSIKQKLYKQFEILELLSNQLKSLNPQNKINQKKNELHLFSQRLNAANKNVFEIRKERLIKLISHLKALDPKNLLKKGYSILFNEKDASIILSKNDIAEDDKFSALVSDGKIFGIVESKK